jgi:hypothetical protein
MKRNFVGYDKVAQRFGRELGWFRLYRAVSGRNFRLIVCFVAFGLPIAGSILGAFGVIAGMALGALWLGVASLWAKRYYL